jgi:hypothetical protein
MKHSSQNFWATFKPPPRIPIKAMITGETIRPLPKGGLSRTCNGNRGKVRADLRALLSTALLPMLEEGRDSKQCAQKSSMNTEWPEVEARRASRVINGAPRVSASPT